ncbi:MAG: GspE/PulE family protein [Burkholderiaceae bacterium]
MDQSTRSRSTSSNLKLEHGRPLTVEGLLPALVADGLLASSELADLRQSVGMTANTGHPLVWLASRKLKAADSGKALDKERLLAWLGQRSGLEVVRIDPLRIDLSRVAEVVSSQYATRHHILPLAVGAHQVTIATAEPFCTAWVGELRRSLGKEIVRVLADPDDIARYAVEFYTLAHSVRTARGNGSMPVQSNFEQLVELGRSGRNLDANDAHVVTIVDWLWEYAFEQRASDIHLEPRRDVGTIRFRIDGVLHHVYQVPPTVMLAMTSRIKLLGRMDVVEKRRPQDGRIKTRMSDGREIELRLSTLPTAFGEKLVMRIFDPDVLVRDFESLGFSAHELATWRRMIDRPNGIVLVTGPTGSGKTTTLYSTLRALASDEVNVCTVEDPIELVDSSLNQTQVQPGIGLNFAAGVRALMRQDPDIIMIGEVRDLETAEMAMQAALTGHLVLTTLHTNDAPSAVTRLLELGIPGHLLNATLVGVLAQRLVRVLCPHCKSADAGLAAEQWRALIHPYRGQAPARVYRPVGCLQCRMTGFRGRAGIYELLQMDEGLKAEIGSSAPSLDRIRRHAVAAGLRPLRVAGAGKVASGLTTCEEVLRVAPPVDLKPADMAASPARTELANAAHASNASNAAEAEPVEQGAPPATRVASSLLI